MPEQIAVPGFQVPPPPQGATTNERPQGAPAAPPPRSEPWDAQQTPPKPGATFTQADLDAKIAEAVAAAQAGKQAPAPQKPAPTVPVARLDADALPSDPQFDLYTGLFNRLGKDVDLGRAINNALTYGKPELVDVAYIQEKGGENAEQLIQLAKTMVVDVQTRTVAAQQTVFNVVGGAEQWNTAVTVFDSKAPAHLKKIVATMLDSGNPESIKSAAETVRDWTKNSGLVPSPGSYINAGATQVNSGLALSKHEFQDAHAKLDKNSRTYMVERDALFAARHAGKLAGK